MALVAYYKLEDVADSSGSGFTLTNTNSVTFTAARFNNGANFGATNSNKRLVSSAYLGFHIAKTMNVWVKCLAEIGSGAWTLFTTESVTTKSGNDAVTYEYNGGNRRLKISRYSSGDGEVADYYTITLGTTNWYMLTYVWDTAKMILYVNGVNVKEKAAAGVVGGGYGANGFGIASPCGSPGNYASILADECRIYNEVLTPSQIMSLYRYGKGASFLLNYILGN